MSDVNPTPDEPAAADSAPNPSAEKSSPWFMIRMVVLLSIFGVALVGLLYDRCIARPALKKADQLIKGLLDGSKQDPDGDGTVTDSEVQSLLGREPSSTEQLSNGKIEIYSWQSGLPTRKYQLWVAYQGRTLALLHSASTSRAKLDLPAVTKQVRKLTPEEVENYVPLQPMGVGGGGPPQGKGRGKGDGKGGGRRGGKRTKDGPAAGAEEKGPDAKGPDAKGPDAKGPATAAEVTPSESPEKEATPPAKEDPSVTPPVETPVEPAKVEPAKVEPAKVEPAKEAPATEAPGKEAPATEAPAKGEGTAESVKS